MSDAPLKNENTSSFSEKVFRKKIKQFASQIGCRGLCLVFQLFYALRRPDLPLWARTRILAALAYFVSFIDAVPDLLPGVGYSDDLLVLIAALGTVSFYIDAQVKQKAQDQVTRFFKDCRCGQDDPI